MTRARGWAGWIPLVLVAAACHGCGFADEGPSMIYNACAEDADCVDGLCDDGICIAASPDELTIALEVVPQSGSLEAAPGSWVFDAQTVAGPLARALVLPP